MSFQFSPLYLHRSSPLNSSLRSFTPATCPQHPIHNAEFEGEIPTLTPTPLFARQGRPLRRILPTTTLETLLATFDLRDELDACLGQWLQDGTASRMREAETGIVELVALDSSTRLPSQSKSRMSFQFSPLYLHRSSPLNSSLRSFTPPQHPIHNVEFEDEIPMLTPAPLFAGQGRPLRRFLPTTTLETLLATFDLVDELDACLDQWLQDGTASRMREAEIAEAEASSQEPMLPPWKCSSLSTDIWAQAGTYQKPMLPSRKSSSLSTDMWAQAGTYRASHAESAETDNSDSSDS